MFVEGQDSVKKELVKRFPIEDFSWIDDIFPKEEEEDEQEERQSGDNPSTQASIDGVTEINKNKIEGREKATEDVSSAM